MAAEARCVGACGPLYAAAASRRKRMTKDGSGANPAARPSIWSRRLNDLQRSLGSAGATTAHAAKKDLHRRQESTWIDRRTN